jgi:hypothetical protein
MNAFAAINLAVGPAGQLATGQSGLRVLLCPAAQLASRPDSHE